MSTYDVDPFDWDARSSQAASIAGDSDADSRMSASLASVVEVGELETADLDIISKPTKKAVSKVLNTASKSGVLSYTRCRQVLMERVEELMDIEGSMYDSSVMPTNIPLQSEDDTVIDNDTPLTVMECMLCVAMVLTKLQVEKQQQFEAKMAALEARSTARPTGDTARIPDPTEALEELDHRPTFPTSSLREAAGGSDYYWIGLPRPSEPLRAAIVMAVYVVIASLTVSVCVSARAKVLINDLADYDADSLALLASAHHRVMILTNDDVTSRANIALSRGSARMLDDTLGNALQPVTTANLVAATRASCVAEVAASRFAGAEGAYQSLNELVTMTATAVASLGALPAGSAESVSLPNVAAYGVMLHANGEVVTLRDAPAHMLAICNSSNHATEGCVVHNTSNLITCFATVSDPSTGHPITICGVGAYVPFNNTVRTLPGNVTSAVWVRGGIAPSRWWATLLEGFSDGAASIRVDQSTIAVAVPTASITAGGMAQDVVCVGFGPLSSAAEIEESVISNLASVAPGVDVWRANATEGAAIATNSGSRSADACPLRASKAPLSCEATMPSEGLAGAAFSYSSALNAAVSTPPRKLSACVADRLCETQTWMSAATGQPVTVAQAQASAEVVGACDGAPASWAALRALYRDTHQLSHSAERAHVPGNSAAQLIDCEAVFSTATEDTPCCVELGYVPFITVAVAVAACSLAIFVGSKLWAARTASEERNVTDNEGFRETITEFTAERVPPSLINFQRGVPMLQRMDNLGFVFADPVGSLVVADASPPNYVRLVGYTLCVLDQLAVHFKLDKVKTIGDGYFAVAGLASSFDGDAVDGLQVDGLAADLMRALAFACTSQMITSAAYRHFPSRHSAFHELATTDTFYFLPLRIGVHSGSANAGVVNVRSSAPGWDCYGRNVGIARRLEEVCPAGRVLVSNAARRQVQTADRRKRFEFESGVKRLLKGIGPMNTSLIASTKVKVPDEVHQWARMEHAVRRRFFTASGWKDQGVHDDDSQSIHSIMGSESVIAESDAGSIAGEDPVNDLASDVDEDMGSVVANNALTLAAVGALV